MAQTVCGLSYQRLFQLSNLRVLALWQPNNEQRRREVFTTYHTSLSFEVTPKRREQNTNRILSLDLSFVKLSIQITTMKLPTLLVFLSLFCVARGQQEQNDYLGVNVTSAVSAYTTVLGRLSLFGFMDKIVFVLSHP